MIKIAFSAAALVLLASGCATNKSTNASNGQTQYVELTGSYLKQPVTRNGLVTDGTSQVVVINQEDIRRSGASDVRQVLNRYGFPSRY